MIIPLLPTSINPSIMTSGLLKAGYFKTHWILSISLLPLLFTSGFISLYFYSCDSRSLTPVSQTDNLLLNVCIIIALRSYYYLNAKIYWKDS